MITLDEVVTLIRREMRGKINDSIAIGAGTRMEDLALSSLQVAQIIFTLEEDHGVEFDAARAADVKNIGDLIALGNEALTSQPSH